MKRQLRGRICFPFLSLVGLLVDFRQLSQPVGGEKKVIKSKYVKWRLIESAEIGLCTQLFRNVSVGEEKRGGVIKLQHLPLVFSLS